MRTWRVACSAAVFAIGLAAGAHADEWTELTYFTFSGPVNMPGITLPGGTYRFELMDPESSRRVIRVSDKEGTKNYGIFLTISDQKMEPSKDPIVMFKEMPAGSPQAIRAWFYPGETQGYEFVYPHDQAMKIAKATHESVLSMNDSKATTDADRVASMRGAQVGRIDENGKPVSSDEHLKTSSSQRPATTTAPRATTEQPTAAEPARPAPAPTTAVGTSGTTSRRRLPRTASPLPLLSLLSGLSLAGALGVRAARKSFA